jgi:6-phosphogluconolactonase
MPSHLIFLGTYSRNSSRGIYALRLDDDTGALSAPIVAAETVDPTWVVVSPDKKILYANHASAAQAIAYSIDPASAQLTPLSPLPPPDATKTPAPSHLAVDATGRTLFGANYHGGYVEALPIRRDGTVGEPKLIRHEGKSVHPTRQTRAYPHSVTLSPDNRFVIVCDLGADRIYSYALDAASATLTPAKPAFVTTTPGSGPRHFKFSADAKHGYAINELGNTITAYDYNAATGALTAIQTVNTLPPDFAGQNITAEVRIHPNGKFLYGSNRGHDSLVVFAIDSATGRLSERPLQTIFSGGKMPRNYALSSNGKWLVCGHQDTALITVFRVDPATGQLTRTENSANVPACVCVAFYD